MLDREERGGEEAPLEDALSNLSSSEPVQNLMFYLTNIAYIISTGLPPSLNPSTIQVIDLIADL